MSRQDLPTRADVDRGELVAGGGVKPALRVVSRGGARYAVKDVRELSGLRRVFWRWLLRREARAYAGLAGCPGIAPSYGMLDEDALVLGYLDGEVVRRESMPRQRADFFDRLEDIVADMHRRGWVHLDLGHRRNVLVRSDGSPGVVDLGASLPFANLPLLGRALRWVDRRSVRRLASRYDGHAFARRRAAS